MFVMNPEPQWAENAADQRFLTYPIDRDIDPYFGGQRPQKGASRNLWADLPG